MDLRKSSPSSSVSDLSLAIPAARRPFPQLSGRPAPAADPGNPSTGHPAAVAMRLRHCVNLAEGALVLIGAYILIGAGIGEAAGSVAVGVAAGLIAGVCAIAAILLITGSAQAARTATHGVARRLPPGR